MQLGDLERSFQDPLPLGRRGHQLAQPGGMSVCLFLTIQEDEVDWILAAKGEAEAREGGWQKRTHLMGQLEVGTGVFGGHFQWKEH